jgi:lysocardiolipin and lysophospholipid acyltransferase
MEEKTPKLSLGGAIFTLWLVLTCIPVSVAVALASPLLLLPFGLGVRAFRLWNALLAFVWQGHSAFVLQYFCGIDFHVHGDKSSPFPDFFRKDRSVILISNHRSRIDWMFIWGLAIRMGKLAHLKIILKESMKRIPGFGWSMQGFMYAFLKRSKNKGESNRGRDLMHLDRVFRYLKERDPISPMPLIFPEGSDLTPENLRRSQAFSEEQGLQKYSQVLQPRVAGTEAVIQCLANHPSGPLDAVYDVTIVYEGFVQGERPLDRSMLNGRWPKAVRMNVERIDAASPGFPSAGQEIESWLRERFDRKEDMLGVYYGQDCYNIQALGPEQKEASRSPLAFMQCFLLCNGLALFLWGGLFLPLPWNTGWLLAGGIVGNILCTKLLDGWDSLELRLHAPEV